MAKKKRFVCCSYYVTLFVLNDLNECVAGALFSVPRMYFCVQTDGQTDGGTDGADGEVRLPVVEALLLLCSTLVWCSRNSRTERLDPV